MAWTTPYTWTVGEILTAAKMQTYVSDNLAYLKISVAAQFWLSGASGLPAITTGCAFPVQYETGTNKNNVKTLDFDPATDEYAFFFHALPSDYGGGTITAKFFWMANDATTNSVYWSIAARSCADGEALDQANATWVNILDANASTAYQVRVSSDTGAVTIQGTPAAGELVMWRVRRFASDGSDNLAVDAKLLGVMITYTRA